MKIDGETENLDRGKSEVFIDEVGFKKLIKEDTKTKGLASMNDLHICKSFCLYSRSTMPGD